MEEIWKDIPEWEGKYQVSSLGRVRSLDRLCARGHKIKGRILNLNTHYKSGYKSVQLSNGKAVRKNVHLLMAMAFIDKDYLKKGLCCNHIDGDKGNNNLSNLEVVTLSENMIHARDAGLLTDSPSIGEAHGRATITDKQAAEIYLDYHKNKRKQADIAEAYNASRYTVYSIVNNIRWTHVTKSLI